MQRCEKKVNNIENASEARTDLATEVCQAGRKDIYCRIGETPGENQNKSPTLTSMLQRTLPEITLIPTSLGWDCWRLKNDSENVVESCTL